MSSEITLSDLLSSAVPVEWYEGVALVREVSEHLLAQPNSPAVPELNQIALSAEGQVHVTGGDRSEAPVRRLGQLLVALTANTDSPVPLRLIMSQATAPSPSYGSVREYYDALAFFERPDRPVVLRALFERATAESTATSSTRALTLDSMAPLPSAKSAEKHKQRAAPVSRSRTGRFAVVAIVIAGIAAGAAWYARERGVLPQDQADVSALADAASNKVGSAVITGASAVTERLGLGRLVPADAPAAPPPAAPPSPPPPVRPPRAARETAVRPPEEAPPLLAFDLDVPQGKPVSLPSVRDEQSGELVQFRVPPEDTTIYSLESSGVTPPVGVRPHLARQLPPDVNPAHLGRIDLTIGADGIVESAKLIGAPRNVYDGLFLSVVKAWSFEPALKDGVPVRYRKTIWIASR